MKKLIITFAGLAIAGTSLTACGQSAPPAVLASQAASSSVPVVSPTPTVTKTVVAIPTPTVTKTVVAAPAPAYIAAIPGYIPVNDGTYCGGQVYAGPDTSCPFALNVAADYSGAGVDDAYSPVTGLEYTMYCNGGEGALDTVTCTGGNNALVDFTG
jgi:hypothetical protein